MVVVCPKCKTRLKVDETRLSPEGSRFKCPKCATVLVVRKPATAPKSSLDKKLVIVAHSHTDVRQRAAAILQKAGYRVIESADGIDVMVKALKGLAAYAVIEVALPKIYGFEVCKRLKSRPETKDMKFVLIPAIHDKSKYRRDPSSLYGADEYIEEHDLESGLLEKITGFDAPKKPAEAAAPEQASAPSAAATSGPAAAPSASAGSMASAPVQGDDIERARRLARTILNDIYLYNSAKVDESLRKNSFEDVFSMELKEGRKLYDVRIPAETRQKGEFYSETVAQFILNKKKALVS